MRFSHAITIAAPIERVWELTVDVEAWPTMTPTITSIERLDRGPMQVGSRARIKQPAQFPTVWTVTTWEPPRLFVWQARVLGVRTEARHELAEVEGGTRNTLVLDMAGVGGAILGRLIGRKVRSVLATENDGFKREAEAGGVS